MKFNDEMQRSLHEATTWHCIICGFSDGSDLMKIKDIDEIECTVCKLCRKWQNVVDPRGALIVVDFKHKRYKRIIRKDMNDK